MTSAPAATLATIARLFLFVRELPTGSNKGRWVEALQRLGNTEPGQPWCMCLVVTVLELLYAGRSPLPPTASCEVVHGFAKTNGWLSSTPHIGDVFLLIDAHSGLAHHAGFVLDVATDMKSITEISGNTNTDGSREGYGVFVRTRILSPLVLFVTLADPSQPASNVAA